MNQRNETLERRLAQGREYLRAGQVQQALQLYEALLRETAHPEAIEFIGTYALRTGRADIAAELFQKLTTLYPDSAHARESLGMALELTGRWDQAAMVLSELLAESPELYVARLFLGRVECRRGNIVDGQAHLSWAVGQAQKKGQWLDEATTPPWLLTQVKEAAQNVRNFQYHYLHAALQPVSDRYGPDAVARVESFIRSYTGQNPQQSPDVRQVPRRQYFPGLPASPWIDTELMPWTRLLEGNADVIREEYQAIAEQSDTFRPFLDFKSEAEVPDYLGGPGASPRWDAFFFYRHGERVEENCARCPRTAALLEQLPLIRLPGVAPEICFSILAPGTHIKAHRGDSNMRVVVHLPLIVPEQCALKVAGEERGWECGKVTVFDDTYEHEAWNRSDTWRVVLLMDAWSPHLAEVERNALTRVIGAIKELGDVSERLRPG